MALSYSTQPTAGAPWQKNTATIDPSTLDDAAFDALLSQLVKNNAVTVWANTFADFAEASAFADTLVLAEPLLGTTRKQIPGNKGSFGFSVSRSTPTGLPPGVTAGLAKAAARLAAARAKA